MGKHLQWLKIDAKICIKSCSSFFIYTIALSFQTRFVKRFQRSDTTVCVYFYDVEKTRFVKRFQRPDTIVCVYFYDVLKVVPFMYKVIKSDNTPLNACLEQTSSSN